MAATENPSKEPHYPWIGKRPFYGWIIVIIAAVTQFFQGLASQGLATFLGPLQAEFGWTRAVLAGPRSVTQIEGAIVGPLEGWLVDKLGPRKVVAVGIAIMGLGFILFGITNSIWMYYISSIVISLGMGLQGLLVMSVTVNNWFRKKRTMAQSLMGLGYSFAGVAGVPALVFIHMHMGWRTSAIITGLVIWGLGFPFANLLRDKPESIGLKPDGAVKEERVAAGNAVYADEEYDFTLKESLHTRTFWLLALAWAIGNLGLFGVQVHLFLHLEIIGMSGTAASLVWMVASLSNIPSRILGGFIGDKFPKNVIMGISLIVMAVAIYVLAVAQSPQMAFVYAVLFGLGWGIRTPIANAIQGEYFGRKYQGIIRGWLQSISLPFTIATPVLAGWLADVQGTYQVAFIGVALVTLVGAVASFLATRPKPPHPSLRA